MSHVENRNPTRFSQGSVGRVSQSEAAVPASDWSADVASARDGRAHRHATHPRATRIVFNGNGHLHADMRATRCPSGAGPRPARDTGEFCYFFSRLHSRRHLVTRVHATITWIPARRKALRNDRDRYRVRPHDSRCG